MNVGPDFEKIIKISEEEIIKPDIAITEADLRLEIPEEDETVIILHRNARDNRNKNSELGMGELELEAAEQSKLDAEKYFNAMLESLEEKERKEIMFLVVAAKSEWEIPTDEGGIKCGHKRAVETAKKVIEGIKNSLDKFSLSEDQFMTQSNREGRPSVIKKKLTDLLMFEDSPKFAEFLNTKNPLTGDKEKDLHYWLAFENDEYEETRIEMGAEGPDEIANRIDSYIKLVEKSMKNYHKRNPNKRVVVWIDTHYDTISPYVKRVIAGLEKTDWVSVDSGAGIVIKLGKDQAITNIQGKDYDLKKKLDSSQPPQQI